MKVIGIDPAPSFGAYVFDGARQRLESPDLQEYLGRQPENVLLCWDAPLTGPTKPDATLSLKGEFTKRPIEKFFTQNRWQFEVPPGISVQGYAGCQHWTISRHVIGLPRVGKWDTAWDLLPFKLLEGNPPKAPGKYVVEVHPALALWLWCRSGEGAYRGDWRYKKDKSILKLLWGILCSRIKVASPEICEEMMAPGEPKDDDDLDSRIAWVLGMLWVRGLGEVRILGSRSLGSFVIPVSRAMAESFESFVASRKE